jgi:hypothetical protein
MIGMWARRSLKAEMSTVSVVSQLEFITSKRLEGQFGRALFAWSSMAAALILATWTNSSWTPDEVPHALPGLA